PATNGRCVIAQVSARCVIAHSFGSGFIVIQYVGRGKDENWGVRGWRRADRADRGRSRRTEDSAPRPPPMEKRGRLRRVRETGAPGSSSKRREKPRRQHSTKRPGANNRFRVVLRCTQQPGRSTAEQAGTADGCETVRAT